MSAKHPMNAKPTDEEPCRKTGREIVASSSNNPLLERTTFEYLQLRKEKLERMKARIDLELHETTIALEAILRDRAQERPV